MRVANTYLSFQGVGFSSGHRWSFDVLVGDNPPTVTGGYAKWASVPRPLQRSLTVFNGYDPAQLTVEVRFGRWDESGTWLTDDANGKQVEGDIWKLEWMSGANFQEGPSPAVYVWAHGSQSDDTDLIPAQYRNVPWVLTGLQWGQSLRNPNGHRIWQDATLTLEHYLNLNPAPPPDTTIRGEYFISKPGRDTPLVIAASPAAHSPLVRHRFLAWRICVDDKNNPCRGTSIHLRGRSLSFRIRHGVGVWLPSHTSL